MKVVQPHVKELAKSYAHMIVKIVRNEGKVSSLNDVENLLIQFADKVDASHDDDLLETTPFACRGDD